MADTHLYIGSLYYWIAPVFSTWKIFISLSVDDLLDEQLTYLRERL